MSGNDVAILLRIFEGCTSNNMTEQKAAEQELDAAAKEPIFFSTVFSIAADATKQPHLRQLACIMAAKYVAQFWRAPGGYGRRTAVHILTPEQKVQIKQDALLLLGHESLSHNLVKQVSQIVAKIARQKDNEWPELLQTVSAGMQSEPLQRKLRYFLTLRDVVYEIMHCVTERKALGELCKTVSPAVIEYLMQTGTALVQTPDTTALDEGTVLLHCWCQKIVMRSGVGLLQELQGDPQNISALMQRYAQSTLEIIKHMLRRRSAGGNRASEDKILKKATKALYYLFYKQPGAFADAGVLLPYMQCCFEIFFLVDTPFAQEVNTDVILNTLSGMEHILSVSFSHPSVENVMQQCFTEDLTMRVAERLFQAYLPITKDELSAWKSEPEEYVFEEDGEDGVTLKDRSSGLFTLLSEQCGDSFLPKMKETLCTYILHDATNIHQVDAALYVLGLCFNKFPEICDESQQKALILRVIHLSKVADDIVRRRALWFLGQWLYVVCEFPEFLPEVYSVLIDGMSSVVQTPNRERRNDKVIQLTALKALQEYVAYEFKIEMLQSRIGAFLDAMFDILKGCTLFEAKKMGLALIGLVVSFVTPGDNTALVAEKLIQVLGDYCQTAGQKEEGVAVLEEVLQCLINVVPSLYPHENFRNFCCDVIQHVVNTQNPHYLEFVDDAMKCWLELIVTCSQLSEKFAAILPLLFALSSKMFETYDVLVKIMHQYFIIGGTQLIQTYGKPILGSLESILATSKGESLSCGCDAINDFMVLFPGSIKEVDGAMKLCVAGLTQGAGMPGDMLAFEKVKLAVLLCRYVTVCRQVGADIGSIFASGAQCAAFVDILLDLGDDASNSDQRKLFAMCALQLLKYEEVVASIDGVMQIVVAAVQDEEMQRSDGDSLQLCLLDRRPQFILRYDLNPNFSIFLCKPRMEER